MSLSELNDSIEELWSMLADQADELEAMQEQMKKRDLVNAQMLKHIERLVADKEFLLKALGWMKAGQAGMHEVKHER